MHSFYGVARFAPLLLLLLAFNVNAALVLNEETSYVPLGAHIEILEDPAGELTLGDIRSSQIDAQFVKTEDEIPNFGFSASTFWVKAYLASEISHKQDWFLEVDYPPLDSVTLYYERNGEYQSSTSGDMYPFAQRDIKYHNVVFNLSSTPYQKQTIYLKVHTSGSMQLPLVLWHPKSFTEKVNTENYVFGIYCGIMLVVIFYNLFLFISVRDYSYLHYVLYVLFFTCIQLVLFGFAFEHLWPKYPWVANHSLVFSLSGTMLFISLFSSSFLHMKTYSPRSHRFFMITAAISVGLMIFSVIGSYRETIILSAGLALILTPMPIFTGLICLKAGYSPARFYLFAWLFLLFGCLAFILKSFGLVPTNLLTTYGAQIGSAIEVILLSLALGDRINYERKEKYQAKIQAMHNLEKSDRLKDEFMATISHELRTPLNGVSCSLALIEEADKKGENIADAMAEAERSTYVMQSLIDDLLSFREAKNDELRVSEESFNLKELFQPILDFYSVSCQKKGIELKAFLDEKSNEQLLGDKKKLSKIITHLLDNAVKFTQQGEVRFEAKFINRSSDEALQNAFMFSVTDTGQGIPQEKQQQVYDAFSQVDSSFTRNYGGIGIGLAICLAFVRSMGGSISFHSEPGSTRFDVVLFLKSDKDYKPVTKGEAATKPLSVLIVEDNPVNQALVGKIVKNMGHTIVKAENGLLGVQAFNDQPFDLVLMDCQMPVMDGFEATEKIRETNPNVPIIAVTANALEKDRQHCFAVGMNDFISKPIQKGEIESVIQKWA